MHHFPLIQLQSYLSYGMDLMAYVDSECLDQPMNTYYQIKFITLETKITQKNKKSWFYHDSSYDSNVVCNAAPTPLALAYVELNFPRYQNRYNDPEENKNKRTMMVLYRSAEQTDLHIYHKSFTQVRCFNIFV